MILSESHQVRRAHKLFRFLDNLSFQSKNIYNMANYIIRQEFIGTSRLKEQGLLDNANWIRWTSLDKRLRDEYPEVYSLLPSKSVQPLLKSLDENWSSFFGSIKSYNRDKSKFKRKPNLPGYKDKCKGRNVVTLTNQQFRIKDGYIHFLYEITKNMQFKPIRTNIPENAKLLQVTISPKKEHYNFNISYELPDIPLIEKQGLVRKTGEIVKLSLDNVMSLDLGINNFFMCSNNVDKDFFMVNGKPIKSINQWANKFQSFTTIGQRKKNKVWRARDNKLNYFFNKSVNLLISKAIEKQCKTIVVGYNPEWKQEVNLGRKTNQSFVQIPYLRFLQILEYKCTIANLNLVKINEAYTSKCSFVDLEPLSKQETYVGKRIKRGLFKTAKGLLINADLNGSLNILKKYLGTKFEKTLDQVEDFVVSPVRILIN